MIFGQSPLELQPRRCENVCMFVVYNVCRNVTVTKSQTQREKKVKQKGDACEANRF